MRNIPGHEGSRAVTRNENERTHHPQVAGLYSTLTRQWPYNFGSLAGVHAMRVNASLQVYFTPRAAALQLLLKLCTEKKSL